MTKYNVGVGWEMDHKLLEQSNMNKNDRQQIGYQKYFWYFVENVKFTGIHILIEIVNIITWTQYIRQQIDC